MPTKAKIVFVIMAAIMAAAFWIVSRRDIDIRYDTGRNTTTDPPYLVVPEDKN